MVTTAFIKDLFNNTISLTNEYSRHDQQLYSYISAIGLGTFLKNRLNYNSPILPSKHIAKLIESVIYISDPLTRYDHLIQFQKQLLFDIDDSFNKFSRCNNREFRQHLSIYPNKSPTLVHLEDHHVFYDRDYYINQKKVLFCERKQQLYCRSDLQKFYYGHTYILINRDYDSRLSIKTINLGHIAESTNVFSFSNSATDWDGTDSHNDELFEHGIIKFGEYFDNLFDDDIYATNKTSSKSKKYNFNSIYDVTNIDNFNPDTANKLYTQNKTLFHKLYSKYKVR